MDIDSIPVKAAVCGADYAYRQIPADSLRHFFDNMFSCLSKNSIADSVKGRMHRWTAGHDLFLDVPKTIADKGLIKGMKQGGHILLTDFPTKDGIPIPGLSKSGLGKFLTETLDVPKEYLCLNAMDTIIGVVTMSEGALDIINVVSNQLRMTPELFLDTFVEGGAEMFAGVCCKNPLLIVAGTENVGAGMVATFNTMTHPLWYVSPVDILSGSLSGAVISLLVSKFILKRDTPESVKSVLQSASVGGLFALSPCFGIGGLVALLCFGVGKAMAKRDEWDARGRFVVSEEDLALIEADIKTLLGGIDESCYLSAPPPDHVNNLLGDAPPMLTECG